MVNEWKSEIRVITIRVITDHDFFQTFKQNVVPSR